MKSKRMLKVIFVTACTVCVIAIITVSFKLFLKDQASDEIDELSLNTTSVSELWIGQSYGVCTHDESYTEPVIPDGKYYPGGDKNADYYMEIKEGTVCLRWQDGSIASDDRTWGGVREYRVVTMHGPDAVMLCVEWYEYTDEERKLNDTLDRYRAKRGVNVKFRDGKAYIMAPAFRAGEGNVVRTDPSMPLSIPDEDI